MVERADGHRVLLAPDERIARFVSQTYGFDDVRVVPVRLGVDAFRRTWTLEAGPLALVAAVGGLTAQGRVLATLPGGVTRSRAFAAAADPVARLLMPGIRTRGTAGGERTEWYCASAQHAIVSSSAAWDGDDLGGLADVDPPVRFGFSSA